MLRIGACVARDELQIGNGHEKFGVVLIGDLQKFRVAIRRLHMHEALIAPNAVVGMDDGVAGFEFGDVAHHHLERRRVLHAAQTMAAGTGSIKLRFGENNDFRMMENGAGKERCGGDAER